jgi:hypothetical protein
LWGARGSSESNSDHSTISKNRHGRFQESKLFEQLFEEVVRQCVEVGLVQGKHLSVDGSFVEANAAKESRIPRQQLAEAAQVNHAVKQYLAELAEQNPVEEPVHQQEQVSTTDPDSTYATKGGTPARLGYYDNYLVDNHSCVIVGVQATAACMSQETVAAQAMIARFAEWQGRAPATIAADTTYGNGEFLQWLMERDVTPHMRTRDSIPVRMSTGLYSCKATHAKLAIPAMEPSRDDSLRECLSAASAQMRQYVRHSNSSLQKVRSKRRPTRCSATWILIRQARWTACMTLQTCR